MLPALEGKGFAEALLGLSGQVTDIALPKFEYMYSVSLKDTLAVLGMPDAFDPDAADFSGMTEEVNDLYISEVLHKCYIRVDELGAEAAAATEVAMAGTGMPADVKEFRADRPFLFVIYSHEDGTAAFMGAVNDPTQK
jgi:serpin B